MSKNHYAALRQTSHLVAEKWPKSRALTRRGTQEHQRYDNATSAYIVDIHRENPLIGREMTAPPMPFGIRLMFRYCHIATLVARQDGASMDELVTVLRDPDSFSTFETLLGQSKHVTCLAETALGLIPTDDPVRTEHQVKWSIQDSSLVVPEIGHMIESLKRHKRESGLATLDGVCPAHRARIVEPLLQDVVTICARDGNLFERSLSEAPDYFSDYSPDDIRLSEGQEVDIS